MDLATRVRQLKHRGLPAVAVAAILGLETDDVTALLDDPVAPVAPPAPRYEIFEATDIVVPAGSNSGESTGEMLVESEPIDVRSALIASMFIEVAADEGGGWPEPTGSLLASLRVSTGIPSGGPEITYTEDPSGGGPSRDGTYIGRSTPTIYSLLHVNNWADFDTLRLQLRIFPVETTVDLHIVRVRCSFLVL